jgi:hypothetical protein
MDTEVSNEHENDIFEQIPKSIHMTQTKNSNFVMFIDLKKRGKETKKGFKRFTTTAETTELDG